VWIRRPSATSIRFNAQRVLPVENIGETRVSEAIDTGATRSFINRALANPLTRLADGTTRIVSGALDLPIELGNQKKTITLLILEEVIGNLLLGIDFFSQRNATLQCGGIVTKIRGKRICQQRERRIKRHGVGSIETDITDEEIQDSPTMELDLMNNIKGVSHIAKHRMFMKHDRPNSGSTLVTPSCRSLSMNRWTNYFHKDS